MPESIVSEISVLVVDDDPSIARLFRDLLASQVVSLTAVTTGEEGLELARQRDFDLAFIDRKLPGIDGEAVAEGFRCNYPDTRVVVITGYGSVESAVNMMKLGVFDYLPKPFKASQVRSIIERVQRLKALRAETRRTGTFVKRRQQAENFVGVTQQIERVRELVSKTAKDTCTVLIQGESGTGKEVVARAIHENSSRKGKPFVTIDCGSISKSLIESELFGHEKGAFTGAHAKKDGLFLSADSGTVFLDEVAEIPLELQANLLRCIETKTIRPVGSDSTFQIDVRLISATNRDMGELSKRGEFRVDLYYRLNFVTIFLPPLRERKDDIPLLTAHFLKVYNEKSSQRHIKDISDMAMIALFRHEWPGNVRELENVVGRAFAVGTGEKLELSDLPPEIAAKVVPGKIRKDPFVGKPLKEIEREAIIAAVRNARGDTHVAAIALGINRSTLYRKFKAYGIGL